MKKYAINFIQYSLIGLLLLFCLQNIQAQSPCEGTAGFDRDIYINYPISAINLDELLAENSRFANNRNLVVSSRWTFISGPVGPRGPRSASISENDDVDFPNTGGGPDEEYVFEYTVTEDGCEDTAIIRIWVLMEDRFTEEQIIYTCEGETINQDDLFNAFSLDKIRSFDNAWYQDVNYVGSDFFDEANYYLDNETPINFTTTGTGAGNYIKYGFSANRLKATVQEIDCINSNIQFSFANEQNTYDGTNYFFELDVMVKTTGNSFKLGSGQLFFNYNSLAFGQYVNAYNNIEITHPFSESYIAGQHIDSDPNTAMYSDFRILDNTQDSVDSWFSWTFNQINSGSSIASDNVTSTASKLCHIKIKYENNTEDPQLSFELENFKNKFTTACSWDSSGDSSNCNLEARTLITSYSSFTLSDTDVELLEDISLYPNPVKDILSVKGDVSDLKAIKIYSISGQQIMTLFDYFDNINTSQIQAGMYFVKLISENASKTIKIIKD